MLSNFIKSSEDLKNFFNIYPQQDHDTLAQLLLLLGVKTLSQYPKLTIPNIRKLLNSSQIVFQTEQNVEKLQENIKTLQSTIQSLEKSISILTTKQNSSNPSEKFKNSSNDPLTTSAKPKKVDFWNQTDEKENLPPSKPQRNTWKNTPELNWAHDFSREVKKLPKPKSPLVIRESRISILSNLPKSKFSSIDEFF